MEKLKNKNKFIPSAGKVLVKQQDAISITSGGVLVPDSAKQRPMEGIVIAVGKDILDDYSSVPGIKISAPYRVKDHVLFGKYDGIEVRIDEEEFLLLDQDQILGKRV